MYSQDVPYETQSESNEPAVADPAPAAKPSAAEPSAAEPPAAEPPAAKPPAAKPPAAKAPAAKPAKDDSAAVEADSALLTVSVPQDALVVVNGFQTKAVGLVRQFKSSGLKPGFVYTYDVEVTYTVDGVERTESKSVKLRSGTSQLVAFATDSKPAQEPNVATVVKLHVPADASVTLAGNATQGDGSLRTYRTSQMKDGEVWTGYTVSVTAEIDGRPVSEVRTIDLVAGSTNELTFDFGLSKVASR
jgi:uncharacterized protein (TIGR03000 family)